MNPSTVVHSTFTVERKITATPERVFHAFADITAKEAWFAGPPEWALSEHTMDFRVGGQEIERGGPPEGPAHTFVARYHEIVENQRIIYSYDMYVGETKLSVSLTTIELQAESGGTRLTLTEQGAFLDGHEDPALREHGTKLLMDALAETFTSAP